eukprot:TRINITY_DN652_c0_g3_i3.p1 TRINITY_DN652_c0_g3~~TRINITY_DN652_c0_g3_i3.p1  ORF type:complete len:329 (-),score=43.77 TRINITY_DN652_c0_g3_i3:106-1092(-)
MLTSILLQKHQRLVRQATSFRSNKGDGGLRNCTIRSSDSSSSAIHRLGVPLLRFLRGLGSPKYTVDIVENKERVVLSSVLPFLPPDSKLVKEAIINAISYLSPKKWWEFIKEDYGRAFMNLGSLMGLVGFSMSDILLLRWLAVGGSLCGIVYNYTRNPCQVNAVLWAIVFIVLNLIMIKSLLEERAAVSVDPIMNNIYLNFFKPFGVTPLSFGKFVSSGGTMHGIEEASTIQIRGELQEKVFFVFHGTEVAVYGGTALLEPELEGSPYPDNISVPANATLFTCPRGILKKMIQMDGGLAAAIYHMMCINSRHRILSLEKKLACGPLSE